MWFCLCCTLHQRTGHVSLTLTVIEEERSSIALLMFAALLQQIPRGPETTNQQKLSERIIRCTVDLSFANETMTRSRHAWVGGVCVLVLC